jgi:hypothetical protein
MTLVETMVAVALGAILVGVITFVWIQSNRIYVETIERLDIYESMRTVLDVVERDLGNAQPTASLEFGDPTSPIANLRKPFKQGDPLVPASGTPSGEFYSLGSGTDLNDTTAVPYIYGNLIYSPDPYTWTPSDRPPEAHWRDEVYVRTFAMVSNTNCSSVSNNSAVIHYRLVNSDLAAKGATSTSSRPSLRRRVWWADTTGVPNQSTTPPAAGSPDPNTDRTSVLADGILDFKVGFFFKQGTGSIAAPGAWYHVRHSCPTQATGSLTQSMVDLVQRDEGIGGPSFTSNPGRFMPALDAWSYTDSGGNSASSQLPLTFTANSNYPGTYSGTNAMSFYYEGWAKIELVDEGAVELRPLKASKLGTDTPSSTPPWPSDEYNAPHTFNGVRPGAKIYLFDATDDDGTQITGPSGKAYFPDAVFTISNVVPEVKSATAAGVHVRLAEPIDFYHLERTWLATNEPGDNSNPSQGPIFVTPTDPKTSVWGAQRTIRASFNVKYRVGFLPSAFLVRMSYDDARHKRVVPVERVVRLLSE